MQEEHCIAYLCAALTVLRIGHHARAARGPRPCALTNAARWPFIEQACAEPPRHGSLASASAWGRSANKIVRLTASRG